MSDAAPDDLGVVPAPLKAACGILTLEGLGLAAAGLFYVFDTIFGSPDDVGGALLAAVLVFAGALALFAGARGLMLLRPGARAPMVVVQLLALPVGYSLGIEAGRIAYGGPILLAAVAVLYLLFTPPSREALERLPRD